MVATKPSSCPLPGAPSGTEAIPSPCAAGLAGNMPGAAVVSDSEPHATRTDFCSSASRQVVEGQRAEDAGAAADPGVYAQYIWCLRYIDSPVRRDRDENSDGELNEQMYYVTDANMNVTMLVGNFDIQRYRYDPYGRVEVLTGSGDPAPGEWEIFENEILFTGNRLNPETGLYHARHREYHPSLGRFMQRDPLGYVDGMSLYAGYFAMSGGGDPGGLALIDLTQDQYSDYLDEWGNLRPEYKGRTSPDLHDTPFPPLNDSPHPEPDFDARDCRNACFDTFFFGFVIDEAAQHAIMHILKHAEKKMAARLVPVAGQAKELNNFIEVMECLSECDDREEGMDLQGSYGARASLECALIKFFDNDCETFGAADWMIYRGNNSDGDVELQARSYYFCIFNVHDRFGRDHDDLLALEGRFIGVDGDYQTDTKHLSPNSLFIRQDLTSEEKREFTILNRDLKHLWP